LSESLNGKALPDRRRIGVLENLGFGVLAWLIGATVPLYDGGWRVALLEQTPVTFEPGAVAIDPLARRRDRPMAIGRRRSEFRKKKSAMAAGAGRAGLILGARLARQRLKIKFRNQRARESAGDSPCAR
jgi:hypothetical protein